jgi:hypothetical protein
MSSVIIKAAVDLLLMQEKKVGREIATCWGHLIQVAALLQARWAAWLPCCRLVDWLTRSGLPLVCCCCIIATCWGHWRQVAALLQARWAARLLCC